MMLIEKAHHWPMLRQVIGDDWMVGPGSSSSTTIRACGSTSSRADATSTSGWSTPSSDLELCLELGVKAIITDRPAYMLELLDG